MQRGEKIGRKYTQRVIIGLLIVAIGLLLLVKLGVIQLDNKFFLKHEPDSYRVVAFRDGDTIVVDMNGTEETIRFIGIDTPETHRENTPVQCYGPEASTYTKSRIGSKGRVRLVADRLTTNRDRYDRLLRYVYLDDGTNLNRELVAKGFAFAYAFPFAESKSFHDSMKQARDSKSGLWQACQPNQDPATGQWHSSNQDPSIPTV